MVKISSHINNLVLVLIAIQVSHNEARRITSEVKDRSLNVTTSAHQQVNDEKLLSDGSGSFSLAESKALTTEIDARQSETRKYSYFYVGAWIYHIPLYATLWFSIYVAFNVLRAIYGHTVINFLPFSFPGFLKFIHFPILRSTQTIMHEEKEIFTQRPHSTK